MSDAAIVAICVIAAVVLLAIGVYALMRARRRRVLRERFGSEYDRTISDADNRRHAERELNDRLRRRDQLEIMPLSEATAARYLERWQSIQTQFVDRPADAVGDAHRLVTTVMGERGYPTDDRDERMALLSVDHADVMDRYRAAGHVEGLSRENRATTEQLRQAFQHYRALFDRLLETDGDRGERTHDVYPADTATTDTADRRDEAVVRRER